MVRRTRPSIWMRNMSRRLMTRWPVRNLAAGMFHKADAIVLENYFGTPSLQPGATSAIAAHAG
jgi:hypothetical protein